MSLANVAQGNAFYVNVADVTKANILTATGAEATSWPDVLGTAGTTAAAAGALVVRDLGKTVRFPGTAGGTTRQEVLRKVELVDTAALTGLTSGVAANGFVGFNEGSGPVAENVFYIAVKPNATNAVKFAKLGF